MSTPEERKRELERKKQKLAEMREKKRQMEDEKRKKLLEHQANPDTAPAVAPSQHEVDRILSDVGIEPDSRARLTDQGASPGGRGTSIERERSPARSVFPSSQGGKSLSKAETTQVNFPPKEHIAYVKGTQTDGEHGGREFHVGSLDFWEDDALGGGGARHQSAMGSQDTGCNGLGSEVFALDESPTHQLAGLLPHIALVKPAQVAAETEAAEAAKAKEVTPFTDEEKATITSAEPFIDFFDRAATIIERALCEEVDIFVDYGKDSDMEASKVDAGCRISLNRCFSNEATKGRVVTCLDFSPQHPELIVASYNDNKNASGQPDGCVAVWNTKFKKDTPEYIFYSQSKVTSVSFGKFHPNLILGGTYSGQICLWDNRQHKKTPVQKSPLSTQAHTHPVFSMAVVGTQNAHNLLTVSTDGRMCAWSLDMLAQPQDTMDLQRQNKQVGVTCLSFPQNDVNNFLVGSDEGIAYTGCRHGTKAGIMDAYEGHFAPITAISCHAAAGAVDFSQLFLTSSFDWTVKLWSTKEARALYSFEGHNDYVTDVQWSPIHPALFACVDGQGRLQLWNINKDSESPIAQLAGEQQPQEPSAFNKCLWMPTGTQLAVGDYAGNVWLYDVHESVAQPRPDEWARLARTLADIKQAQIEQEELALAMVN